jgi:hypothetical protein
MSAADQKFEDKSVSEIQKKGPKQKVAMAPKKENKSKKTEGAALIGIDVAKEVDLAEWYQQVITKGNMISFYDVSGCYILKPASYSIWEYIKVCFLVTSRGQICLDSHEGPSTNFVQEILTYNLRLGSTRRLPQLVLKIVTFLSSFHKTTYSERRSILKVSVLM